MQKVSWRIIVLWSLLSVAVGGLLWRLVDLNVVKRAFLLKQSQARILRKINISAHRGIITDRLGSPLAISTPAESVWVNPQLFHASHHNLRLLAHAMHLPVAYIKKRVNKKHGHVFVYLKRAIPPEKAKRIKALNLPGVFFQSEYRRYYPEGEIAAHVVGFTNIDDQGQEGLELAANKWLSGEPGKQEVIKDRLGHIISTVAWLKKPVEGKDLQLSIDHRIQYTAYRALQKAVNKFHAQSGSVVVLDVDSGEVLAMVNQPAYNPNNRHACHNGCYRNRAATDTFEPGSVIKPFVIALALESDKYTPDTKINTNPGWMRIGGYTIKDDLNYGVVTLTQLLQKSSNIASAKVLMSLNPENYWSLLHAFGFGARTKSGFPGESSGRMVAEKKWYASVIATLAYGYGISVTPLQLAHAYMILASDGVDRPVTFFKGLYNQQGDRAEKQILSPAVAKTLRKMLETVVKRGGTGTRAHVSGYRVAGKTGTAYIAGPTGYDHHHYMSSFVGMAPASHPKLVVAVVIRDPQGEHFGGLVAAPVFSNVMQGALRLLDVAPDLN